jgi:hypothetical protein
MAKKIYPVAKSSNKITKQPKRVLIGTPALDGRVDAWFCFALHEATKKGIAANIDFSISLLSYESILPMARNEILTTAIQGNFDGLFFIDSDVYVDADNLISVIKSNKDVACIPTVKKADQEQYDIYFNEMPLAAEWVKADRVSTSCLYLSQKALKALSDNSTQTFFRGKQLKNICQYDFVGEAFMGEDIYLCEKLKALGFEIWVNTTTTCMHIGPKVYKGNFRKILEDVNQSK